MAKQSINIGSSANDGTGTPLRSAFDICNDNFIEIYAVNGGSAAFPSIGSAGQVLQVNSGGSALEFATPTDTNTQLTQEQVEDFVGGMLDGTETGITVGYDDTNGNIDFVVASQTANDFTNTLKSKLDGIEASATADQTASEIRSLVGTGNSNFVPSAGKWTLPST